MACDGALFRGRAVAARAQPDQPVSMIGLLPQPQPIWISESRSEAVRPAAPPGRREARPQTLFIAVFPLIGLLAAIFILPEVYGYTDETGAGAVAAPQPRAAAG